MHFEPPRPRSHEERVLPLVNVVFLLLIFFMLAGRLAATDPFPVEPPQSRSEGSAEARELRVLVGADGRLALNGEELAPELFRARVTQRLDQDPGSRLRLKADGRAEATRVVTVMEWLREAGARRIELLTLPAAR